MDRSLTLGQAAGQARRWSGLASVSGATLLWVGLTVLTVGAYLLWGYLGNVRTTERQELERRLAQAQREYRDLTTSLTDTPDLRQRHQRVAAELALAQEGLVGSAERVALIEALAALAERVGVQYSTLSLSGGGRTQLRGETYELLQVSTAIKGPRERVLQFVDALQAGVVPGMTLQHLQMQEGEETTASLTLRLYARPTEEPRFALPPPLFAVGPAAEPALEALPIGALAAPVLTWEVRGRGAWRDELHRATFAYQAPAGSIGAFFLYAETTGDTALDPEADRLLARATPGGDGRVSLVPTEPFHFQAEEGQRFYLAAEVRPGAPPSGELEVLVAPGALAFTSAAWPPSEAAEAFHVRLPLRLAPVARHLVAEVEAGQSVPIRLSGQAQQGELGFRIVSLPQHGWLVGEPPIVSYVARSDFEGEDTFSYVATDGVLHSAPATVRVRVLRPNTAPEVLDLAVTLNPNGPTPITLVGRDADGDPLHYTIVRWPKYGRLRGEGTEWTYTPDSAPLEDSFTYRVSDGREQSGEGVVLLQLPQGAQAPSSPK